MSILCGFDDTPRSVRIHSNPSRIDGCIYIDPNPISKLNNEGHNYFLSQNPYGLNSYAGFGEAYYNVLSDLKLTAGLRWTDDQKHFVDIPSELLVAGWGYPVNRRRQSAMGPVHRPRRRQLDAEARLHRSDAGLCAPMRMATRPAAPIRRAPCCSI